MIQLVKSEMLLHQLCIQHINLILDYHTQEILYLLPNNVFLYFVSLYPDLKTTFSDCSTLHSQGFDRKGQNVSGYGRKNYAGYNTVTRLNQVCVKI